MMTAFYLMLAFMLVATRWLWPTMKGRLFTKALWILSCMAVLLAMLVANRLL